MECIEGEFQVNLFVDGRLDSLDQVGFFKHLQECPECRSFLDSMMQLKQITRREQIAFPSNLDDVMIAELSSRKKVASRTVEHKPIAPPLWRRRIAFSAPATILLCIVMVMLGAFIAGILGEGFGSEKALWKRSAAPIGVDRPATVLIIYETLPVEVFGERTHDFPKRVNNAIQKIRSEGSDRK